MEIKYQIFENENLLIYKFKGDFSLEDYKHFSRFILEKTASFNINKLLIDFRDLEIDDHFYESDNLNANIKNVAKIRKDLNPNIKNLKEIIHVFWVDQPQSTVLVDLFIENFPGMNYHYCSTVDSILSLLKLPKHLQNLNEITNNLKNTF